MSDLFDRAARKQPANLTVNSDLLAKARALDINLSATLEKALADSLRQRQRQQWLDENRDAISAYNDEVERDGTFSDGLRGF